jgi:hypothetical protein
MGIELIGNFNILEAFRFHHMAPVARRISDADKK